MNTKEHMSLLSPETLKLLEVEDVKLAQKEKELVKMVAELQHVRELRAGISNIITHRGNLKDLTTGQLNTELSKARSQNNTSRVSHIEEELDMRR